MDEVNMTLRRERDAALALLADVRLLLQDPRLPTDSNTARRLGVQTRWLDREERIARAVAAEIGLIKPDMDDSTFEDVTAYRNKVQSWLEERRIGERIFEGVFRKTIDA